MPKDVKQISAHFLIIKILHQAEFQQIALNHSPHFDFKDFIKIYKKCTAESYSFFG